MTVNNPFASTQVPTDPAASVEQKAGGRGFEIAHNMLRGLFVFFFVGLVPVFNISYLRIGCEEFGVELPLITQLVFQFSKLVCKAPFISLPLSLGILAMFEYGIFLIPSSKWKVLANFVYWAVLILVIGSAYYSVTVVYNKLFF